MKYLILIFVITPIVEMWVLIKVGGIIGALPTIGLVLLTAVIGLALLKQQGISTLMRARQRMQDGQMPAKEMVEGIFLAIGGALLLTPGFVTDTIGFACLLPGVRGLLISWGLKHIRLGPQVFHSDNYAKHQYSRSDHQTTIEGLYRREDDEKK